MGIYTHYKSHDQYSLRKYSTGEENMQERKISIDLPKKQFLRANMNECDVKIPNI